MSACPNLPLQFLQPAPRPLKTAADLSDRIDLDRAPMGADTSRKAQDRRSTLRVACKRLGAVLGRPLYLIRLEETVDLTAEDFAQRLSVPLTKAAVFATAHRALIRYAASCGWTCQRVALEKAWEPVRIAMRGKKKGAHGYQGLVNYAIQNNITPCDFSAKNILAWRESMFAQGRSLITVNAEERIFRARLRKAMLQGMFPHYKFTNRKPTTYRLSLKTMSPALREEILGIIAWKTAKTVVGRPVAFRIRPETAEHLQETLLGICGFAQYVVGICGITSLRQVLRQAIISAYIVWLQKTRKRRNLGIRTMLYPVHALTWQHPLFAGPDHEWFLGELRRLTRESKNSRRARKSKKLVPYAKLKEVPNKIRAERETRKDLTEIDKAWSVHDELFTALPLHLPLRQKNQRQMCEGDCMNLTFEPIPFRARRKMTLLPWAKDALNRDPEQKFWILHFVEKEMKNKEELWVLFPLELVLLLREYLKSRQLLVRGYEDPKTLFMTRHRKALNMEAVIRLVAKLCHRHIRTTLTPHIQRDIYSAYFLLSGGSIDELSKKLGQSCIESTWIYCGGLNTSYATVLLENHFAELSGSNSQRSGVDETEPNLASSEGDICKSL